MIQVLFCDPVHIVFTLAGLWALRVVVLWVAAPTPSRYHGRLWWR